MERAIAKYVSAFRRFLHLPLNSVSAKLHSMILTYFLKVIFFKNICICELVRARAQMYESLVGLIYAIEQCHCKNYTLWPWPMFWRSTFFNFYIFEMVRASAKNVWVLYQIWNLPSNDIIAKVVLCDHDLICRFWHLLLNSVITKIVLHDRDLVFEGNVKLLYLWNGKTQLAQKCVWVFCRLLHLPSNGVIAKIKNCTTWPWPTFWRSQF